MAASQEAAQGRELTLPKTPSGSFAATKGRTPLRRLSTRRSFRTVPGKQSRSSSSKGVEELVQRLDADTESHVVGIGAVNLLTVIPTYLVLFVDDRAAGVAGVTAASVLDNTARSSTASGDETVPSVRKGIL